MLPIRRVFANRVWLKELEIYKENGNNEYFAGEADTLVSAHRCVRDKID